VQTVKQPAAKPGIGIPEAALYEGAPNAFAPGALKNSSLWPCPPGCSSP